GYFFQSGGTLNAAAESIGQINGFGQVIGAGIATLSGGVHHVTSNLDVLVGSLTVSGTATVNVDGTLRDTFVGTVQQTGGTVNVGAGFNFGSVQVGTFTGTGSFTSIGQYLLSDGTLNILDELSVGYDSNGTFDQSGGTVTL